MVLYLDDGEGDISKVRITEFPDGYEDPSSLNLDHFVDENFYGSDLVAVTVKGDEDLPGDGGSEEGKLFVVDGHTDPGDLPITGHVDETYSYDEAFGDQSGNSESADSSWQNLQQTNDDGGSQDDSHDEPQVTSDDSSSTNEDSSNSDQGDSHSIDQQSTGNDSGSGSDDNDQSDQSDQGDGSDDVIFGGSEHDLFLFGSLENDGSVDGVDGPNWTDSIEEGGADGSQPGIEDSGWTQGIEDDHTGGAVDGGHENTDDADNSEHIRTEESVGNVDHSDTIDW